MKILIVLCSKSPTWWEHKVSIFKRILLNWCNSAQYTPHQGSKHWELGILKWLITHCASTNEVSAQGVHAFSGTVKSGFLLAQSKTHRSSENHLVICYKPQHHAPGKVLLRKYKGISVPDSSSASPWMEVVPEVGGNTRSAPACRTRAGAHPPWQPRATHGSPTHAVPILPGSLSYYIGVTHKTPHLKHIRSWPSIPDKFLIIRAQAEQRVPSKLIRLFRQVLGASFFSLSPLCF